jgi:hypothetical protein
MSSVFGNAVEKALKRPEKLEEVAPASPATVTKTYREGKVLVGAWIPKDAHKQLKRLAVDLDTNIQDMLTEAINEVFRKNGLREIA